VSGFCGSRLGAGLFCTSMCLCNTDADTPAEFARLPIRPTMFKLSPGASGEFPRRLTRSVIMLQ